MVCMINMITFIYLLIYFFFFIISVHRRHWMLYLMIRHPSPPQQSQHPTEYKVRVRVRKGTVNLIQMLDYTC